MTSQRPSADRFQRQLVRRADRVLVESTCRVCRAVIVGSVTETLLQDEERHARECEQRRSHSVGS